LPHLIEAFPDVRVLIAGEGPMEEKIRAASREFGVQEHILWLGRVPDVRPVMEAADVVVLPSNKETLGYVLMEAMALERPVVATRTGGIPELVEDGRTGRLVQPGNATELAGAIAELLRDPAKRRLWGAAGRSRVIEKFSLDAMVLAYEKLYRAIVFDGKYESS